jgi:hypothetical protein
MKRHWIKGAAAYALLLGGGIYLGQALLQWIPAPDSDVMPLSWPVLGISGVYVLAAALPFVPGAEIGLSLMMVFGMRITLLVYLCMVAALWLAFGAGRLVPSRRLQRFFLAVNMRRAARLVRDSLTMSPQERCDFLMAQAPGRLLPFLLRHRYLALIVVLNVPGNVVLSGGGGLALFAGLSRLFAPLGFCLATALAVAPVPVMVMLLGYQP